MAGALRVSSRIPGPWAIRPIVAGWLAVVALVRFGELGSSDVGWTVASVAFLAALVVVQSLYIVAGRRLRGTALGWSVVAVQAVLTYVPFLLYGEKWMSGNSGFLLGAVLLTAGPVAGLPVAIAITAAESVLSYFVLHMTAAAFIAYAVTAPVDNGVQFWGLVTLAQVAAALRAERAGLARLAEAEERSRAERTLRDAFSRLLVEVEGHVDRALQTLATVPIQAGEEVAAAVRTARECQDAVRSAADEAEIPDAEPRSAGPVVSTSAMKPQRHSASIGSALTGQVITVLALSLLLVAYFAQGTLDAVDDIPTALLVPGSGVMILAAIVVLYRRRDELAATSPRLAAYLRIVAIVGAVAYPVAFVVIAVLTHPSAGVWTGTAFLVGGIVLAQWRDTMTWGRLVALAVGAVALTVAVTPDTYDSAAEVIYYLASVAAIGVNSYGMVRLVEFEGALARTRRRAVTLAALRERTRVARDVHDLLGLGITTIVLKGELAARLLATDPERARAHLTEMRRLTAEAAAGARTVVEAGGGAEATMRSELRSAERTLAGAGIAVDLLVDDGPPPGAADAVCGVVLREAITNVLRHSAAEQVRIAFGFEAGRVLLRVENDGLREAAADLGGPTGRGLRNMASRVAEAGGRFDAGPADGWFRLSVDLPM